MTTLHMGVYVIFGRLIDRCAETGEGVYSTAVTATHHTVQVSTPGEVVQDVDRHPVSLLPQTAACRKL